MSNTTILHFDIEKNAIDISRISRYWSDSGPVKRRPKNWKEGLLSFKFSRK